MQFYLLLALVFALVVAIFAVQNTEPVTINFLTWQFKEISLVLVILGSSAVGAVFLFLLGVVKQLSLYRKNRELRLANQKLREEVNRLEEQLAGLNTTENQEGSTDESVE